MARVARLSPIERRRLTMSWLPTLVMAGIQNPLRIWTSCAFTASLGSTAYSNTSPRRTGTRRRAFATSTQRSSLRRIGPGQSGSVRRPGRLDETSGSPTNIRPEAGTGSS